MNDVKLERYGALVGGVLFVLLVLIASFIAGAPPAVDDSAGDIADYFRDHDSAIQIGAYLSGLAALVAVWWLGSLWRAMRRAEGGDPRLTIMAAAGLVIAGASALANSAVLSAVALRIDDVDVGAKFFYTLAFVFGSMASFGIAALVFAVSALAIRTGFLPRWLGWAGGALAVLFIVAGGAVAGDSDAIGAVGFVAFLLWLAWFVVVSVILYRKRQPV